MTMVLRNDKNPVVLFDGFCVLCSKSVWFIIKRDKTKRFRFASLDSDIGREVCTNQHPAAEEPRTIVLVDAGKSYTKSDAVLRILGKMPVPWRWLKNFTLIPKAARDAGYDFLARHRYKWFGSLRACRVPTPEERRFFLDL